MVFYGLLWPYLLNLEFLSPTYFADGALNEDVFKRCVVDLVILIDIDILLKDN